MYQLIAEVCRWKSQMQFQTRHLFFLMTAIAVIAALVAPIIIRHYQSPLERFNSDLAIRDYESPRLVADSTFDAKNSVGLCIYYTLAYRRPGSNCFLLRHAYFDPSEPWYVRNWHPLSNDLLKRYGYDASTDLHDVEVDHKPSEEDVARFIQPLRKIIDEPRLVLQQLDY